MPSKIDHQLNLKLTEPDTLLDDSTRAELVSEMANLIFLFWKTTSSDTIVSEDNIDE